MAEALALGDVDLVDLLPPFDIQVDPATGSPSYSLPLPLPSGRLGFGPALALAYDSTTRNTPYGFGWNLTGPSSITVFDRRSHPRYDGTDQYALGGMELVPAVGHDDDGIVALGHVTATHDILRYRCRYDHALIRVERWTERATGDVHWRARRPDGSIGVFGHAADGSSRIRHPGDPVSTYEWLIDSQHDRFGNCIRYHYRVEDGEAVDWTRAAESRRLRAGTAFTQRLLKRVQYGNAIPLWPDDEVESDTLTWHFEVVLDYGDHSGPVPSIAPDQQAPVRRDSYSSFRPGFEVRTYRLCRRILVFHRFAELGGEPLLTRSIDITHREDKAASYVEQVVIRGFRHDAGAAVAQELPALSFRYSASRIDPTLRTLDPSSGQNLPQGIHGSAYRWVDVRGEGLPGILTVSDRAWYYKPNLGGGRFGPQERLDEVPSAVSAAAALSDFDRDGNFNLVVLDGTGAGYFEFDRETRRWASFKSFASAPVIGGPGRQDRVDVGGDGRPDTVLARYDRTIQFPSEGKRGFGAPVDVPRSASSLASPVLAERPEVGVFLVDMSGDGAADIVHVGDGRVEYWPHCGGGRIADPVVMSGPPVLPDGRPIDVRRLRFADLDGTGTADILYLDEDQVHWWTNAAGNEFIQQAPIRGLPITDDLCDTQVIDLLGEGTDCLVWSSGLASDATAPLRYIRLMADGPPRRLISVVSAAGGETHLEYSSSAAHYRRDECNDDPWLTRLPSHPLVVDRKITIDRVAETRSVTRYSYHSGLYDSEERVFRGFLCVDVDDSGSFHRRGWGAPTSGDDPPGAANELPPEPLGAASCRRLFHHPGDPAVALALRHRYWSGDPDAPTVHSSPDVATSDVDAYRCLAGRQLRHELFAVDDEGRRHHTPIAVSETAFGTREVQPAMFGRPGVFAAYTRERIEATYEEVADDPRVEHRLCLSVDSYGVETLALDVAYPRRAGAAAKHPSQSVPVATITRTRVTHHDDDSSYLLALPIESETFTARGIGATGPLDLEAARSDVGEALTTPLDDGTDFGAGREARRLSWDRTLYWNDARTAPRPLGEVGVDAIVHHERSACFGDARVNAVYGQRVTAAMLTGECQYLHESGHWWARGDTHELLSRAEFSLPTSRVDNHGVATSWKFDPHLLLWVAATDQVDNTTTADLDYQALAAWRITDANKAVCEARYDAFGVATLVSTRGTAIDAAGVEQPYGARPLDEHAAPAPTSTTELVGDPAAFVADASRLRLYDLTAFTDRNDPISVVDVVRETLVDDVDADASQQERVAVSVSHYDGLGRVVQLKEYVEPGRAIARDASGAVITGPDGVPTEAFASDRWHSSGHVVYDSRQQAALEYEAFYTTTPSYEADPLLQAHGVSIRKHFDAVGRLVRCDLPNGTSTSTVHAAWSTTTSDPNDLVSGSDWELLRQPLPAADPERAALTKALAHAGTPTVAHTDPLGREVLLVEQTTAGRERRSGRVLDDDGNTLSVHDGRGLRAIVHDVDMVGRRMRTHSMDAGDEIVLLDASDQVRRRWDSRGHETATMYDRAGRPTALHVTGSALNQVVERVRYGDEVGVAQAAGRNARGRAVQWDDGAGRHEVIRFTPDGQPIEVRHQLRSNYAAEPNWDAPGGEHLEPSVFTARSAYDGLGRPIRRTSPDGTTRTLTRRPGGAVVRITVSTDDGSLDDHVILANRTVCPRGRDETIELGNAVSTDFVYDETSGRLARATTRQRPTGGPPVVLRDVTVTRDPVGNITSLLDRTQEPANPTPLVHGLTVTSRRDFTYDPLYRLTAATGRVHQALLATDGRPPAAGSVKGTRHLTLNNGAAVERYTRTYRYDIGGNLEEVHHAGATHSWTTSMWVSSTSNRRILGVDSSGIPITSGENWFDSAGNTVRLPHVARLQWDHHNRLRTAVIIDRGADGGPNDAEHYVYDSAGRRVRKVTERLTSAGLQRTDHIYLEGCELLRRVTNASTELQRTVAIIGEADDCVAAVYRWTTDTSAAETSNAPTVEIRYQVADHLGSTVLELDEHGDVITYEEHFPFGGSCFVAGNDVRRVRVRDRRFTGKERDDATGLYYYGYRYYAPWIGGWLSPDPLGIAASLNLYEFVANDPINLVDRDGLEPSGAMAVLGQVPTTLTRDEALRYFNNGRGLEVGIRALDIRRDGDNWIITRQENISPRLRHLINETGLDVEEAAIVHDIETMFEELNTPPADPPPPNPTGTEQPPSPNDPPPVGGRGGGGTTAESAPPPGDGKAKANAHRGDGTTNTAHDPGSGTGVTGTGTGSGITGSGPGGGTPTNTPASTPSPDRAGPTGKTGATAPVGGGGQPTERSGETRLPGGTRTNGVPGGIRGGAEGGHLSGHKLGSVDGQLDGVVTGAPTTPPPDGAGPNGQADGSGDGTATGQSRDDVQRGRPPSTSRTGPPTNAGSGNGSSTPQPGHEPTTLDRITKAAGYWHLEFGNDANGVSGGVPGGMGFLSGWGAQLAFLGLTVADVVLTVLTLGQFKAALIGLKAAIKSGLRAARQLIGRGLRGIAGALRRLWISGPGQKTPMLRRLTRSFFEDRTEFGMWKDFRARWGIGAGSGWSMEHMIIKQRWYRGSTPVFAPGTRMNRVLQGLGDAGWNVVPIPGRLNTWLYNNPVTSAVLNYGTYAAGGYGLYELWDWALETPDGPTRPTAQQASTATTPR